MHKLKEDIEKLIDTSHYDEACELVQKELNFTWNIENIRFESKPWDKDGQKRNIFDIRISRDTNSFNIEFGSFLVDSCIPSNSFDMLKDNDTIELFSGFAYKFKNEYTLTASVYFNMTKKEILDLDENKINQVIKDYTEDFDKNAVEYNKKNKYTTKDYKYKTSTKENFKDRVLKAIEQKVKELQSESSYLNNEQKIPIVEPRLYDILTCLTKYDPGTFENFCSDFGYDEDSRSAERTYNEVKQEYLNMCTLFNEDELEILQYIQ